MTERKRIPYAASALIDQARMDASSASRSLMSILNSKARLEDQISLVAKAALYIKDITISLNELRSLIETEIKKGEDNETSSDIKTTAQAHRPVQPKH